MFLALREIRHEPTRFALIVAVITLVAYVTFFLAGLAVGLAHAFRSIVDSWDAAAVILTEASNDNIAASRISPEQVDAARRVLDAEAGRAVEPVILQPVVAQRDEDAEVVRADAYAWGIDLDGSLAPHVVDGRGIETPSSEVLLDESLKAEGWALGDTFVLAGTEAGWTVVGFTDDLTFQTAPIITLEAGALEAAGQGLAPAVNAIVVPGGELDAGSWTAASAALADEDLRLMTEGEFVDSLPGYSAQVLTFGLMIGALVLIAALVLGIFLYVLTLQKRSVLGILKARGVPTSYLIVSGGAQTAVLAAVGVGLGFALVQATRLVLPTAVPFLPDPWLDAGITAAFIVVALVGGLSSVRVVARIDPVEAIS